MPPPMCTPSCRYYDYAHKLEAQGAIIADLVKQRDDLIRQRDDLIATMHWEAPC